jgi:hypothetical protein
MPAHAVISLLPIPRLSLARTNQSPVSQMSTITTSDAAKAVVRRNTEEVQGGGNFGVFEELFADDFVDHTPQPNTTPDKEGVRKLYGVHKVAKGEGERFDVAGARFTWKVKGDKTAYALFRL